VLALTEAVQIIIAVAAFFLLLAALALLRLVVRKTGGERWRRFRIGVFVERDVNDDEEEAGK
jgi:hypothetical protein